MRLCIATPLYPPESGGPATYVRLLEERLPSFGVDVDVVKFSTVRNLPKGIRHLVFAWRCYVAARHADAVLVLDSVSVGVPARIAARLAGKPCVVRVPGDHAWEQARQRYGVADSLDEFQTRRFGWRVELLRSLEQWVVRGAQHVIVPSDYMRRIVSSWAPRQHITMIYSGVALPVPTTPPPHRPEGFLIVTIGRLVPWKGMDAIIRTITHMPEALLAVVGDGPDRAALLRTAKEEGVDSRVIFTGELPRNEALGWAAIADVFVLNSTYEGLSHVVVEVMSLGTPIIVSDAGGNPELIDNGVTGIVVPAGNEEALRQALAAVKADPSAARTRGAAAVDRAKNFSIDQAVVQVQAVLKSVCES